MRRLGTGTFLLEQILQTLRTPGHLSLAWHSPNVTPWATPLPSAVGWGQVWVHLSTPKRLVWKAGSPSTLGPPNLHQLSANHPKVMLSILSRCLWDGVKATSPSPQGQQHPYPSFL